MGAPVRKVTELEIRRLVLGLDRSELAVELELCCEEGGGINTRTVRRWEVRLHHPFALFRRALCKYFDVRSVAELGLGDTLKSARWWAWMTEDEWIKEVHRRKALEVLGSAGLVLPGSWLTAVAQLLEARRHIGDGDVAFAMDTATDIAVAYAGTPDAGVVRSARAHAYTLLDRLDHATMSVEARRRLEAVACDAACLAGYGELRRGRLVEAEGWFADGVRLARQAGDRRLEALALASRAWIPYNAPDLNRREVVAALEAAAGFHPFLPPAARAWVFAVLAEQNAALGEDLVSGRFLEHAQDAVALVHYEEPGWGWWSTKGELAGWDGVRPQVFTGARLLGLGRSGEALELFNGALEGITLPSRRSNLHKHLMESCVGLDDPDRACASAHAALDEAKRYGLELWPKKVRKVRRTFPKPWSSLRVVAELDQRLALAG